MSTTTILNSFQIKGKGIGRDRIVPTINLQVPTNVYVPYGVYATWVQLVYPEATEVYMCAVHFGPRPVIGDTSVSLELHVLNSDGLREDFDPKNITIELVEYVREIRSFNRFEELKQQIWEDISLIREILQKTPSHLVSHERLRTDAGGITSNKGIDNLAKVTTNPISPKKEISSIASEQTSPVKEDIK